ncbi:MAG: hypothetical protein P0119_06825 [Nitrospira sp.]|nr:hypothetical protein [Nitrospira sp.]
MLPRYWMWSPQVHYPLSGSVLQDISPDLGWFFGAIKPEAGVGSIEKEVFEKASYGRQLGLILDVLLPLVGEGSLDSEKAKKALVELKNVYEAIEKVKLDRKAEMEQAAVSLLRKIEKADKEMLSRVIRQFGSA